MVKRPRLPSVSGNLKFRIHILSLMLEPFAAGILPQFGKQSCADRPSA